jgi:hypothetical protein
MRKHFAAKLLLVLLLSISATMDAQQPPAKDRAGNSLSIVRNDSTAAATIEYRLNNQWQQIMLEPGKDATIKGDRIRVATTREDQATVTVDLPIQAGKKYRLLWNTQSSIWDFSPAL